MRRAASKSSCACSSGLQPISVMTSSAATSVSPSSSKGPRMKLQPADAERLPLRKRSVMRVPSISSRGDPSWVTAVDQNSRSVDPKSVDELLPDEMVSSLSSHAVVSGTRLRSSARRR